MQITIRLFAALRERAGTSSLDVELPDDATAGDAWAALSLGEQPPGIAYAINRAYAEAATPLQAGDELALIPPVSGGAAPARAASARLTAEPLDLVALIAEVSDAGAGAVASFLGTVRDNARGRRVLHLEYEAFDEMAVTEMERIAADAVAEHGCIACAIAHRTGRVEIGEASVAVAVSAAHRGAALAACAQAIDTLKVSVPIWKKERYEGGEEWIGQGA